MIRMLACAYGLRRMAAWAIAGQLDVVEVAAVAGDEPGVLAALERGAEDVVAIVHRPPRSARGRGAGRRRRASSAAASRIAATMLW